VSGRPNLARLARQVMSTDEAEAACVYVEAVEAELERVTAALAYARKTVSWFYDDHVIDGDPPCPCEGCTLARKVFADALAGGARAAQEETVVLACNCVGTPCEGGWTITTVALFCPYKHRRGVVVLDDPKRPGRRRKWSRSASGDARAAQEDK
jgi:hypothetical protein